MPVPPAVDDLLAARGYINPLTAMLMLKRWPVAGKHLVLTAASSSCASLLGQWALAMGARSVSGIIRSPQHRARTGTGRDLSDPRYRPGADGEGQPAQRSGV